MAPGGGCPLLIIQSDEQTEIVNKVLQQYLKCFVHAQPKEWGKFLHWAEWHYNTSVHTVTDYSPYHVVYGKPPPSLSQYICGSSQVEAVDVMLTECTEILAKLRSKLTKARTTMKLYADRLRIPHPFKEGDMAFVKLRPFRQSSVAGQRNRRLSMRY